MNDAQLLRYSRQIMLPQLDIEGQETLLAARALIIGAGGLGSPAAIRMEGQLAVFDSRQADSPCYHCLYKEGEEADQTCSENGVLSPVVGIIGSLQALGGDHIRME